MIDECAPASHLYIAVPAYTGEVTADTAHSLCEAALLLARAGIKTTFDFICGCCYLDTVRNILSDRFLRSGATDLLFVDADVGFAPESVLQIAAQKRPFVAGVYPKKNDNPAFPVQFNAEELRAGGDGLVEAWRVPTGFLRLNRLVFDSIPSDAYRIEMGGQEQTIRAFFKTVIGNGEYYGEDYAFCDRWRGVGGKIYILPELTFGHSGQKRWTGNWGAWMRSRHGGTDVQA